jgi:hypothetical protein
MEVASVSTNVITKSNISTSTDLLTMNTFWIDLQAHLPWHVYPDFTGYVWEVMVKANGSNTTYVGGLPVVTINNPPDCLQPNTVYYLKSTTSGYISPKIYSFHTSVANADADIKIDFVTGEMGTGSTFNLIFIRKNYTQNTPNGGSVKLNRFIAEPLGEMACCYKETFGNMTEASFYFAPLGATVTCKKTSLSTVGYGPDLKVSYQGTSGIYSFTIEGSVTYLNLVVRWRQLFGTLGTPGAYYDNVTHTIPLTITGTYEYSYVSPAPYSDFGSGTITFQTPMTIPDVRLYMPDAYLFVATGHHKSVGTIDTTLTYDTGTGCWVSEVLNHYNIPGRIYFSANIVPRDFGHAGDWVLGLRREGPLLPYGITWNDYAYTNAYDETRVDLWSFSISSTGVYGGGYRYLVDGNAFTVNMLTGGQDTVPLPNPRVHMAEPNRTVPDGYGGTVVQYKMKVVASNGWTVDWPLTNQIAALPNGTPLVFYYGPMAISYSYYQRAIKSRFTAFSTYHSTTSAGGHPTKGLFRDDLRDSAFWQGADRFVIRSDSNDCYMTSLPPLPPPS